MNVLKDNKEHERKFLVQSDTWRTQVDSTKKLRQLYVCQDPSRWLTRVRLCDKDQQAWLTIKGPKNGISNPEFEYEIPYGDALEMWNLNPGMRLTKIRSTIKTSEGVWEIDEFLDPKLKGLVMAEFEIPSPDFKFERPDWVGGEVSFDPSYRNDHLALLASEPEEMPGRARGKPKLS